MGQHSQPIDEPLEGPVNYAKAGAAVVATILAAVAAALTGDAVVDATEWLNVAVLAVGALGVFAAPNVPGSSYTKSVLAVLSAVLVLAVNLIAGGIDLSEWIQLGLAALGALGVYSVPNTSRDLIVD